MVVDVLIGFDCIEVESLSLLFEDERGQSDGKSWSATGGERC